MNFAEKDPSDVSDRLANWGDYLEARAGEEGDTIVASTWTVPDGITKAADSIDDGFVTRGRDVKKMLTVPEADIRPDTGCRIWLSGGAAGSTYSLVNRIVTAGGRTYERTFTIRVRER